MEVLRIEGLVKRYAGHHDVLAVAGVDLHVEAGELLVLLGPSGCGKTTLLRCIAGLERPNEGRILLGDTVLFDAEKKGSLPAHKRDSGMVFQNYSLWPHMTVAKNVAYPLRARGVAKAERATRVNAALDAVSCGELAQRLPAMLSGGQQQRVALARALVSNPSILLLDEPLSNLDALLRVDLRTQLRELHREFGFTGVYVTHDQAEALNLGTRIAVMDSGRIEQLGTPEEVYRRPATEYVARFLGIRNSFTTTFNGDVWRTPAGRLAGDTTRLFDTSAEFRLFVRPRAVTLAPPDDGPAEGVQRFCLPVGVVEDAAYSGDCVDYVVSVGDVEVFATVPVAENEYEPGDRVRSTFASADTLIYHDGVLLDDVPVKIPVETA